MQTTFNIVAKLVSWGRDGIAKVEPLMDIDGVEMAPEIQARVAEDHKRRQLIDFSFRRKQGLRVGGAVMLRKSTIDPDLGIVCKEVDIMRTTEKEGVCVVKRHAAAFIHAPESSTSRVPSFVSVAVLSEAKRIKTLRDCISSAVRMVEDNAIFGIPTLFLTSENRDGNVEELTIEFEKRAYAAEEIEAAVTAAIDTGTLSMIKKSKTGWWLVPTFKAEIEPEAHRQGKLNAQYANIDYGPADEPMWTKTNAVLRGSFNDFFIADVSPTIEPADSKTSLLVDLLPKP